MMFLRYQNEQDWWELVKTNDDLRAYNYRGGWHSVNENFDGYVNGTVVNLDSWNHLYERYDYCPFYTEVPTRDMWIAPNGQMYDCGEWGAHEITAQHLLEIIFGEDEGFWDSGDRLIEYGWVKVTTSLMFAYYHESGMYDSMTDEQWVSYQLWREKYRL